MAAAARIAAKAGILRGVLLLIIFLLRLLEAR